MINIAIDGPAGAGKSTIAKYIAEKLDIPMISKSRSSLFLCCICNACAVPPHRYMSLMHSNFETFS